MIILDTNVLSEPMRADGNVAVAAWLDRQIIDTLYLTTVNLAELLLGIELLPLGLRRSKLKARIGEIVNVFGERRTLVVDARAARLFSVLVARARAAGLAVLSDIGMAMVKTTNALPEPARGGAYTDRGSGYRGGGAELFWAGSVVGGGFPGRDLTVRGWGVSRNDDRSALTAGCGGGLPIWPGRATMAVAEEMGGQDDRSGDPWRQGGDAAGYWRA
jgi:predicted nucleic acid-binding protein